MKLKIKSLALVLFAILATLLPTASSANAATSTYTATKKYAVALGYPYNVTLSVQNNTLVVSGWNPDYCKPSTLNIALIKPLNYAACTIDSAGIANVTLNPAVDITDWRTVKNLKPTVVKSITHPIVNGASSISPVITVIDAFGKSCLTYDWGNVPKLSLAGVPDGVYIIGAWLDIDPSYHRLYCDNILIVIQGGKANLQLLPSYRRRLSYAGACLSCGYEGYRLDRPYVQPATSDADYYKWSN